MTLFQHGNHPTFLVHLKKEAVGGNSIWSRVSQPDVCKNCVLDPVYHREFLDVSNIVPASSNGLHIDLQLSGSRRSHTLLARITPGSQ